MGDTLRSLAFRREREASWRELEALVARAEAHGLASLGPDEVSRLPELYRGAISSLSVARAISLDRALVDYLEALAARAYLTVYASRRRLGGALLDFFRRRLPALVWSMRRGLVACLVLLAAGTAAGWHLTAADPDRYHAFVPEALAGDRGPASTAEELRAFLYDGSGEDADRLAAFSSWLVAHNAGIGLLCFALGFAAGIPVLLLVFTNGLTLGAFLALHARHGLTVDVLGWLLPHGITELLAVCVCGAAGLAVGHAVLFPGRHGRVDQLARRGREAAAVVVGAVALFLLAGLLEGFFRQLVTDVVARYAVAAATLAFWVVYLGPHARRQPPP